MIGYLFDFLADIGLGSPIARAAAFGATGFGVQYLLKPSISYTTIPAGKQGQTKAVAKDFAPKGSTAQTTWFPWFMWPLLFAIIGGLFV